MNRSRFIQANLGNIPARVSLRVRKAQFESIRCLHPFDEGERVLDVGVTLDERADSNFFEKLYPHSRRLVAVGMEDLSALRNTLPPVLLLRADGRRLPFADHSFQLVTCFATLEHAGNRESQRALLHELCRVGDHVCVTTPNRWFPLEFHTILPLVHWLPPSMFRAIARRTGQEFFSEEMNLNLLSEADIRALLPPGVRVTTAHSRLLGWTSNLLLSIECQQ